MKVLGLDVGTKTIGLATGLSERRITQPLRTLMRKSVRKDTDILAGVENIKSHR